MKLAKQTSLNSIDFCISREESFPCPELLVALSSFPLYQTASRVDGLTGHHLYAHAINLLILYPVLCIPYPVLCISIDGNDSIHRLMHRLETALDATTSNTL